MNVLFIVVLLIFALCIFRGYRKGFLRIVYSMVSWIIIFAVVSWASPHINDYLRNHTSVYTVIAENVEQKLQQSAGSEEALQQLDHTQQLESIGVSLPSPLMKQIVSFTSDSAEHIMKEMGLSAQISAGLADFAVRGLSSIIAWVFAALTASIISRFLGIVSKIPIVRGVNRYLGVAAGLVYGLLLVWTAFCVIALCGASEYGAIMIASIYENRFLTVLYENNLVLAVFTCFIL